MTHMLMTREKNAGCNTENLGKSEGGKNSAIGDGPTKYSGDDCTGIASDDGFDESHDDSDLFR